MTNSDRNDVFGAPRLTPGVKSIFVTGAASGIGRATALHFARRGWFIGLFDVNEDGLDSLAGEIGAANCCLQTMDVTNTENFEAAVKLFSERTNGTMDALFNCAGVTFNGRFEDIPLPKLQQTIRINVEGTIIGAHLCLPLLRNTAGAHIISMSSASAFYGVPEMGAYSASKAAIRGLTEALNLELEKSGVVVCDIMPSFVSTPMITAQAYEVGSIKALGVRLTPAQVAHIVWQAAHARKVHWVPEWRIRLINAISRCLPMLQRRAMKWIAG